MDPGAVDNALMTQLLVGPGDPIPPASAPAAVRETSPEALPDGTLHPIDGGGDPITATIVKADKRNATTLARIDQTSYASPMSAEQWRARFEEGSKTILAKDKAGTIVGFLTYRRYEEQLLIERMGVLPEFRRAGVGNQLVNFRL